MATFDYEKLASTALEILIEFGAAVALLREESGADYDPSTGAFSGGTTLTRKGTGALVNYHHRELANSSISATDKKLLYRGDALAIGDRLNGWRVHALSEIDPASTGTVLTIAQMRK